ncbi:MAG: helix-turn-helix domain-containing protein [Chloroflexi bacterium]|nr:MAG: helix-turn-helix domain-containing protein [Chloroflexota bacterium]
MLNTKEAAGFLRVSEASIRRWSDSGLLPGVRVGRRRERRFIESDLLRFMDHSHTVDSPISSVMIAGTPVSVPSHLATLFSTDVGGLRLTVPFFADGIRLGQPCLLVAAGDLAQRYLDALREMDGVDLDQAMRNGTFTVVRFDGGTVADAIGQWEQDFAAAVAKGPTVIRVVGEMVSERTMFVSENEMLRYEEAFELMSRRFPTVTMCQYDVRHFDGVALLRAIKAHPDLFSLRFGTFLN